MTFKAAVRLAVDHRDDVIPAAEALANGDGRHEFGRRPLPRQRKVRSAPPAPHGFGDQLGQILAAPRVVRDERAQEIHRKLSDQV